MMNTTEVEVVEKTAVKTKVGTSILFALFVASAYAVGGGFLAAMLFSGGEGGGGGGSGSPMLVTDIVGASLAPDNAGKNYDVTFWGRNVGPSSFGYYFGGFLSASTGYHDGDMATSPTPLSVTVASAHPALNIRLTLDGNRTVMVCVPSVMPTSYPEYAFYIDVNGNSYFDRGLTRPASPSNCPLIASRAFAPTSISSSTFATHYAENPLLPTEFTASRDGVQLSFMRTDLGHDFVWEVIPTNPNSKSPFMINIRRAFNSVITAPIPANVLTLKYNADATDPNHVAYQTLSLCIPETRLVQLNPNSPDGGYGEVVYFFDKQGTPYRDALLTLPATSQPCNQILAKAFTPTVVSSSTFTNHYNQDQFLPTELTAMRDGTQLSFMRTDLAFDFTWETTTTDPLSKTPFAIKLHRAFNGWTTPIFPANTLTLQYDPAAPPNVVYKSLALCVPATQLTQLDPSSPNGGYGEVTYFYDASGKAYTDALMTQNVSCATSPSKTTTKQQLAP